MRRLLLNGQYIRVLAGLAAGLLLASHGYAGSNQVTTQGQPKRWRPGTSISYTVNGGGVPGFTTQFQQLAIVGAVDDAFRAWTAIPGAAINFRNAGISSQTNAAADAVNLVTFQDSSFQFAPGTLAVALVLSAIQPGPTLVGSQVISAEFAGQILDVDIVFNSRATTFSPVGAANSVDLVAIATHEVGHLLGLDHSAILSSIMNPFGDAGITASRVLQSDDTITVSALYPVATFAANTGTITGTVTTNTGSLLKSAHVVVISQSGAPVASQLSGPDGRYTIAGLPSGTYTVLAEPLDSPITLNNFEPFYRDGQASFATGFLGGSATPTAITVAAGQTATANLVMQAKSPTALNIDGVGTITQPQPGSFLFFSLQGQGVFLPRGKSYTVGVTDQSNQASGNLAFSGNGISSQGTTTADFGRPVRQASVTVNATAALGPSNVLLSDSGSLSFAPGGVITTVNPSITHPLRPPIQDNAGFGATLAPGAMFAIFGTDLAPASAGPGGLEFAQAIPLPTSLGGVSVRFGDRYAPLIFVSPAQIVGVIPTELTGSTAQVTVVAGANAAGNTVTVNLSPTAPGIFTANSSGTGQGIVQNADLGYAAPVGAFPFPAPSHPARRGDVIIIWASGLGPVTPSIPSGLTPGSYGVIPFSSCSPTKQFCMVNFPRVLIGGQEAVVQFAGLQSGNVALYQVNAVVPSGIQTGSAVPVQIITAEGQASNTVTIAVE